MSLTVSSLHKMLAKLIADGHGRKPVCINKRTFSHPLETDGVVILNIHGVTGPEWIAKCDDDGDPKINRDGSEAGSQTVILIGDSNDD